MRVTLRAKGEYALESFELTEWHKNEGDHVDVGEVVFSYEDQKSSAEGFAKDDQGNFVSGILVEIKVPAGAVVNKSESDNPDNWNIVGYLETD